MNADKMLKDFIKNAEKTIEILAKGTTQNQEAIKTVVKITGTEIAKNRKEIELLKSKILEMEGNKNEEILLPTYRPLKISQNFNVENLKATPLESHPPDNDSGGT